MSNPENGQDGRIESELILNPDGSIYHLALSPGQVAPTIITVGDPARVERVSRHFDVITHKSAKREFVTHTGRMGSKELTVISTGIGAGNVDIVINELDALFNLDLLTGFPKMQRTRLKFIRIGTSGAMQEHVEIDQLLASAYAMGLDGVGHFYSDAPFDEPLQERTNKTSSIREAFQTYLDDTNRELPVKPYFAAANGRLLARFGDGMTKGITVTSPGFYAPQCRQLRLPLAAKDMIGTLSDFTYEEVPVTNFEMETATLYALAHRLGHAAVSLNAILANRATGAFSKQPKKVVNRLIMRTLNRV